MCPGEVDVGFNDMRSRVGATSVSSRFVINRSRASRFEMRISQFKLFPRCGRKIGQTIAGVERERFASDLGGGT